jgi:hypothetical protein
LLLLCLWRLWLLLVLVLLHRASLRITNTILTYHRRGRTQATTATGHLAPSGIAE